MAAAGHVGERARREPSRPPQEVRTAHHGARAAEGCHEKAQGDAWLERIRAFTYVLVYSVYIKLGMTRSFFVFFPGAVLALLVVLL